MGGTPAAEVDVGPDLVRTLLAQQHPDLLPGRELVVVANGWDNVMLRFGTDLSVRMPRRELAAALVEHEQRWLPLLADRLPTAVPAPLRVGLPGAGYPWSWSVLTWLPGDQLGAPAGQGRAPIAGSIAGVLAALHGPAPPEVERSRVRGVPLRPREPVVRDRLERLVPEHADSLLRRWLLDVAPPDPAARLWVHGDLHPLNLLVERERLSAVIDWGDITAGDPACDLAIAWLGFEESDGRLLRTVYDDAVTHDLDLDLLWARARGWALHLALVMLDHAADAPAFGAVGEHALARLRPPT